MIKTEGHHDFLISERFTPDLEIRQLRQEIADVVKIFPWLANLANRKYIFMKAGRKVDESETVGQFYEQYPQRLYRNGIMSLYPDENPSFVIEAVFERLLTINKWNWHADHQGRDEIGVDFGLDKVFKYVGTHKRLPLVKIVNSVFDGSTSQDTVIEELRTINLDPFNPGGTTLGPGFREVFRVPSEYYRLTESELDALRKVPELWKRF